MIGFRSTWGCVAELLCATTIRDGKSTLFAVGPPSTGQVELLVHPARATSPDRGGRGSIRADGGERRQELGTGGRREHDLQRHASPRSASASAYVWYERQHAGLGAGFVRAVEAAIAAASVFPDARPVIHRDARRILVQRFPYCLFYRLDRDGVILIACLHAARDPELGHSRIADENR